MHTAVIWWILATGSLARPQTRDCGFAGDCKVVGDGDYSCPGDCSLFVKCSNGMPNIMECSAGTFFDESKDQCVWTCPWTGTTPTTTSTTTPTTDNCFVQKCQHGTNGPEYYRDYEGTCSDYFQCDFDVWCMHSCKWGLLFDMRKGQEGCKLPPLCPNCLIPGFISQPDLAAARHMQNASVMLDKELMNTPMCTYLDKSPCTEIFQPIYGYGQRGSRCTKEFKICYRGWSCFMRCDGDFILDPESGQCLPKHKLDHLKC